MAAGRPAQLPSNKPPDHHVINFVTVGIGPRPAAAAGAPTPSDFLRVGRISCWRPGVFAPS